MKHFAIMIAGLAATAVVLAIIGGVVYSFEPSPQSEAKTIEASERITPVGAAAAAKAAASQVAYGGTTDGKVIFDQLCTTCHTTGAAGAPKITDKAAWAPRIAEGIATLIKHAEDGYTGPDGNHMPARGGNPALTDAQIEATVKWMVSQVK